MRIRYAYKLEDAEGNVTFKVLNHHKSDQEVLDLFADKGIVNATFHERVRTGFRLSENGELVETGLIGTRLNINAPSVAPASPKSKKSKKGE